MSKKLTKEEFIERAKEAHGDKYDYSKVEYKNTKTSVTIICKKHNTAFQQSPEHHLSGYNGCPECKRERTADKNRTPINEFITKAEQIYGIGTYDYSHVKYNNLQIDDIELICSVCGTKFTVSARKFLAGTESCPVCGKTNQIERLQSLKEDFINRSIAIHGEGRFSYDKVNYSTTEEGVILHCNVCGEDFIQSPHTHLRSDPGFCPNCERIRRSNDFLQAARKKFGNKFSYDLNSYINGDVEISITDNTTGETFSMTPTRHLYLKTGYPPAEPLTTEMFISRAEEVHGKGRYDYSKSIFINVETPVIIKCNSCGNVFEQTPHNHLSGSNCPICAHKMTEDQFFDRVKIKYGDMFDFSKSIFIDSQTEIEVVCNLCGSVFKILPTKLTSFNRTKCPHCHFFKGEKIISNYLSNIPSIILSPKTRIYGIEGRNSNYVVPDFNLEYNGDIYWIEYNGQQHYEYIDHFHSKLKNSFENQLKRDRNVREYCKNNNIVLIEIPYIINTEESIKDFLNKTLLQGIDPNTLVDYNRLYKLD